MQLFKVLCLVLGLTFGFWSCSGVSDGVSSEEVSSYSASLVGRSYTASDGSTVSFSSTASSRSVDSGLWLTVTTTSSVKDVKLEFVSGNSFRVSQINTTVSGVTTTGNVGSYGTINITATDTSCSFTTTGEASSLGLNKTWSTSSSTSSSGSTSSSTPTSLVVDGVTITTSSVSWSGKSFNVVKRDVATGRSISMPAGNGRMTMDTDKCIWLASVAKPTGYPIPSGYFYELQACEAYGMYLCSITRGIWDYDEDEDDYYDSYTIEKNITLTTTQFNQLWALFN